MSTFGTYICTSKGTVNKRDKYLDRARLKLGNFHLHKQLLLDTHGGSSERVLQFSLLFLFSLHRGVLSKTPTPEDDRLEEHSWKTSDAMLCARLCREAAAALCAVEANQKQPSPWTRKKRKNKATQSQSSTFTSSQATRGLWNPYLQLIPKEDKTATLSGTILRSAPRKFHALFLALLSSLHNIWIMSMECPYTSSRWTPCARWPCLQYCERNVASVPLRSEAPRCLYLECQSARD